ncbi:DUF4870 domain-containing protein [Arthrobacter sp. Y-9]|uniref:DUF4870 domain-containing protein n=1 Tax=Arthrobacter sp. Y-9 TaxID=3039385 RepID=UPI00241CD087|nr:DUF4870 domain-containing protein [Arthrobacter sp. Y-9]WFR85468.1 DUF4870 domain-containing protein [Arthrobacter sp. Y-9]
MSDASGPKPQGASSPGDQPRSASGMNGGPAQNSAGQASGEHPYTGASAVPEPLSSSEDRQWAMLAHFGGILGFIPSLLIYLIFKDRGPFTAQESKEALNFTLPPTLVAVVANILSLIPWIGGIFAVIAALIWIALTVFSVIAGVHVNRGQPYRYKYNLRLIK